MLPIGSSSLSAPAAPESVASCGIPVPVLEDLFLKHLYLPGLAATDELSHRIRLPVPLAEQLVQSLAASGDLVADADFRRLAITSSGRQRANDAFSVSRYLGPTPVSLLEYQEQCQRQVWNGNGVSAEDLQEALSGVCVDESDLSDLRLAISRGGSLLLTGRSGNGKSLIASRIGQMIEQSSEVVFVPYAIWLSDGILKIFDPGSHHPLESAANSDSAMDHRWRSIRRPVLRTSLELTRSSFDVTSTPSGIWQAPFHVLANGGVLIVDDLGRQGVPLSEFINRWIEPLELQSDHVSLPSGRRLNLPVNSWLIFVVGDDAPPLPVPVQRRIRSQIRLHDPDRDRFAAILFDQGRRSRIEVDEAGVEELFTHCYNPQNPPKCSDPENLLQTVESLCRIQNETVCARPDLLLAAARRLGLPGERRAA